MNKSLDVKDKQPYIMKVNTTTVLQQVLLATAIAQFENEHGDSVTARALLDQGAEFSFVTERIAQCLTLPKTEVNIPVSGVGGASAGVARRLVPVTLNSSFNPDFQIKMEALTLKKLTPLLPSSRAQDVIWEHVDALQLADPEFGFPARVDCIIGAEIYGRLLTGKIRETMFGWVLSGFTSDKQQQSSNDLIARTFHARVDQPLHDALSTFWEVEELPKKHIRSPEDEKCEEHFKLTHSRDPHGRFIVRLPLVSDPPELGDSRSIATAHWLQTENKLKRNPDILKLYRDIMLEYLNLGHMEIVENEKVDPQRIYYIPHYGVLKQQGEDKKLRVVFNAPQKTNNGNLLNGYLLPGPKLQEDLWIVMIRWRFYFIVFVADIIKMFRQILIHRRDTDLLRIVWRESPDHELLTIRLLTVTYGTTPAPYQAVKSLLQLALIYEDLYPRAAELVRRNRYVDDFLAGADSVDEAKDFQDELMQQLWILGSTWDEPVPVEMRSAWIKVVEDLRGLEDIRIPRWLGSFTTSRMQLHGFSDASERTSNLVIAKTKVAPIKTLSMPRLELRGAHLLAKLMREILDAMEGLHFDVYCWTNVKIVISWLADHPSRWTTFVATRTSSILTLLPGVPWQHVNSGGNPADLTTRGLTSSELRDSLLWWRGPDWLTKGTVPKPPDYDDTPSELPDQRAAYKATFITQKITAPPQSDVLLLKIF